MIRIPLCLLAAVLATAPARAGTAQLAAAGATSVDVWTENLPTARTSPADGSTLGFGFGMGQTVRFEGKAAFQQNEGLFAQDGGYLAWVGQFKPATGLMPGTQLQLQGQGSVDALTGAYTQSFSGLLHWKPGHAAAFVPALELAPELVFQDGSDVRALGVGAEWVLHAAATEVPSLSQLEVKAHLRYRAATDADPSVFAGIELSFKPD